MARRLIKPLSLLLGVWMFMFGFLKFFQPIRGWFDIQIQQSHLPHEAIIAGKVTEMITGALFLLPWFWKTLSAKSRDQLLLLACLILITQMVVAINLCPPAAWGACQRSSSRHQASCDSRCRAPPRSAHCRRCLEGVAGREG